MSSRASSPSPSRSPTEVTTLIPPSSRPRTPTHPQHGHARKVSVSTRSVAGSVRGYGAVPSTRPSPVEQAPRVSKAGQRRILTTVPLQITFFALVTLTFLSVVLTLILLINTGLDLSGIALPFRGSGFAEFWISAVGSWIGLGGLLFYSHPSVLFFFTTLLTLIMHLPVLLLTHLNLSLRRDHSPFILIPFIVTALTLIFTLLSNYLVRRARYNESQRIVRMLTDAAGRERNAGEEGAARAMVGLQGSFGGRIVGFLAGILGFIAGLAGFIVVTLLVIDMSISAYDSSVGLPDVSSRLVTIKPKTSPWSINIHLTCTNPPSNETEESASYLHRAEMPWHGHATAKLHLPTILYEGPSGVPGSLSLMEYPLPPANEGAENPGRWIWEMQKRGDVGRVCTWDRPGYGFSEMLSGADLGGVADALYQTLDQAGEIGSNGFLLVGEAYGGLVTRVFAARHAKNVHSLLHLDAQTAQTYFNENPRGLSASSLLVHRLATRLFPSLLTPLSLGRFPSVLLRRSSSLSRVLASTHPKPSTERLNENLRKARLQESFGSHSHTSGSFRALLESGGKYPSTKKAIVISSVERMKGTEGWAEGQRGLAEEVTSEEGLIAWEQVEGVGHGVCEGHGKKVCERSVKRLIKG